MPEWAAATGQIVLALGIVVFMQRRRGLQSRMSLRDKDTALIYVAAIAIPWSIWLFGYWSVAIVSSAARDSLVKAGLTASPVVSGALRNATGSMFTGIYLDTELILVSALLHFGVRRTEPRDVAPAGA